MYKQRNALFSHQIFVLHNYASLFISTTFIKFYILETFNAILTHLFRIRLSDERVKFLSINFFISSSLFPINFSCFPLILWKLFVLKSCCYVQGGSSRDNFPPPLRIWRLVFYGNTFSIFRT